MLAMALEANGIASLRYDKRGVGESAAVLVDQTTLRIEDYMRDASAWIEYLMNDERLGDVFVIGHSEGALIGMVAAQAKPVTGYISIAGVGRSADKLLGDQLTKNIPVRELATKATEIIGQLAKGKLVSDIPPDLVAALDSSIQPYLISWFKYEPSVEIGKLGIPILIVQGTTDLQVSEADANTLHSAAKQSGIVIVPGMNHVLKPAEGDLMAQVQVYSDPDLPLHKDLAQPIVEFIKAD